MSKKQSTYKPNYIKKPVHTHCALCGKALPDNRHPQMKYCNASHRVMDSNSRRTTKRDAG